MATTSSQQSPSKECAVLGVGVLGISLCQQLLDDDWRVTGITKSTSRHEDIINQVANDNLSLTTMEDFNRQQRPQKFPYCVFCAPPSGFDDYPAAVEDAILNLWNMDAGGTFVFTSSGGIYGPGDSTGIPTVNEDSPLPDPADNPRSARLMAAEETVRAHGGTVLRLAGLYTLDRGAHNFWLASGKGQVSGGPDGIINLLHYDDAAGAVMAALQADPSAVTGKTFLISDGNPLSRKQICESTLRSAKYSGMAMPKFLGTDSDPLGKIYDGSATNKALNWKPGYPSFDQFMRSQQ
jgi:nucleoside-diphosphate-sugar epimerase